MSLVGIIPKLGLINGTDIPGGICDFLGKENFGEYLIRYLKQSEDL